ncbi:MAG: hypothetical protein EOO60_05610, partial [Hymenobacter sp.]
MRFSPRQVGFLKQLDYVLWRVVVPGYLGSNKVVDKWAKIAHKNKVMMVTDFEHYDTPEDVIELFEEANLT